MSQLQEPNVLFDRNKDRTQRDRIYKQGNGVRNVLTSQKTNVTPETAKSVRLPMEYYKIPVFLRKEALITRKLCLDMHKLHHN